MTTIAFLGAGNIAQAIMGGMIENGMAARHIWARDPSPSCMDWVNDQGINAASNNDEAIAAADVVMLCIKPNVLIDVLAAIGEDVSSKLFISVAAGITTEMMTPHLPIGTPIIRCMPNTPVQIQTGMTALFPTQTVTDEQRAVAQDILTAVGQAVWVDSEADLDSVTAVSGSGPAYFFLMMESMISAAEALGLQHEFAKQLVLQTALGSAKMAHQSPDDPATLREKVTSPSGTTQAAIEHFQAQGFEKIVDGAVTAAQRRSVELANEN